MRTFSEAPPGAALPRSLEIRHVAMISIGGIIGSGLFVGSSAAIAATGPIILVSYLLAGLIVLLVMRMLSEMAVAAPGAGSFTEYVRLGLGDWAGFASGWLYWGFWVLAVALESIAGASILALYVPLPVWQIGMALLAAMSAINLLSARMYGESEFWLSTLKIVAIVLFIAVGGVYVASVSTAAGGPPPNLFQHGGFAPFGVLSAFSGATAVSMALVGAEIVTIAAAESNAPTSVIAKLTTTLIVRILLFYVASTFVILSIVPWNSIHSGDSPFALALEAMNIPWAPAIMNAVVVIAVLSCLNSGLYVASRVLFTLSARGEAPKRVTYASARGVPSRAIALCTVIAAFCVALAAFSPGGVFAFLVNAMGAIMLVIYLLVVLAQIRYRRLLERTAPQRLTIKTWFFPWASYATIAAIAAVMVSMTFDTDLASQMYAAAVCFAVAVAVHRVIFRTKSRPAAMAEAATGDSAP